MKIAIDFDGTCVTHEFPNIGQDIGAIPVLKDLVNKGHKLILFTMRSGKYLDEAVTWFKDNNIELYGINTDPEQKKWTSSPKAFSHLMIDDTGLGTPLIYPQNGKPYVNWNKAKDMINKYIEIKLVWG